MKTFNAQSKTNAQYCTDSLIALIQKLKLNAIKNLHIDSRQINPGDAFIALTGSSANGCDYISSSIANGATVVIYDAESSFEPLNNSVDYIQVTRLNRYLAEIAKNFYDDPKIPYVVGITGTNGKTTVAHGLAQALNYCGKHSWIAGTLGYGSVESLVQSNNTTLDIVSNWRLLHEAANAGIQYVIMEVSSHAIAQGRIQNIPFELAVFTNLSRDHIDYHGTLEAYADTKLSFLKHTNTKQVVVNACDTLGAKWVKGSELNVFSSLSYEASLAPPDWSIQSVKCHPSGIAFDLVNAEGVKLSIESALIGEFNAINLAQIFMSLVGLGVDLEVSKQAVERIQPISGRMQRIKLPGKPLVIVDYAHTPDALEKALLAIRAHQPHMIICVFGCGGDRDAGKRPIMGEIAVKLADRVIVTNDNPRTESADAIVADIVAGITNFEKANSEKASTETFAVILDRGQAIQYAINQANINDIVLIAGKGHEAYQEIAGQRTYFSDQDTAVKALESAA